MLFSSFGLKTKLNGQDQDRKWSRPRPSWPRPRPYKNGLKTKTGLKTFITESSADVVKSRWSRRLNTETWKNFPDQDRNSVICSRPRQDFKTQGFENNLFANMGVRRKKCRGGQKHSRDGHLSESYSQVSVSDRVTNWPYVRHRPMPHVQNSSFMLLCIMRI